MITNAILTMFLAFIRFVLYPLTILSDVSLNPEITAALLSLNSWLRNLDQFMPVSTLLAVLAVFLSVETAILTYKLIKWSYSKIPGIT